MRLCAHAARVLLRLRQRPGPHRVAGLGAVDPAQAEPGTAGRCLTPMLGLLLIAALTGCRADLRTAELRGGIDTTAREAGRRQVDKLASGHGYAQFARLTQARVAVRERWSSTLRRRGTPLPSNDEKIQVDLDLREVSVRGEFVGGSRAGEVIGIKDGLAYTLSGRERIFEQGNDEVERYFEELKLFIELPFSPRAAADGSSSAQIASAGSAQLDGRSYERLFIAMDPPGLEVEAGARAAQSLFWIGPDDRVEWAELVDMDGRTVVLHYQDYRTLEGAALPGRIDVCGSVGERDCGRTIELGPIEVF